MQIKDPLASRFTQLRESGLSVDDAWRVIAIETLEEAGLVEPESLQRARVHTGSKHAQIPVLEAKLFTTIRIEPADDDRIKTLLARARQEAILSKADIPDQSSIIRQALRLGLDELERRNARK